MKNYKCPCGGELVLLYQSDNNIALGIFDCGKGNHWLTYECPKCKERFTTTESDTISFTFPNEEKD